MRPFKSPESRSARMGLAAIALSIAGSGLFGAVWLLQDSEERPAKEDLADIFVVDVEREFALVPPLYGELPGEFEHHEALLIGWPEPTAPGHPSKLVEFWNNARGTILSLIAHSPSSLKIFVIVPSSRMREIVREQLAEVGISSDRAEVIVTEANSQWVRDFAPFSMRSADDTWIISPFIHDPGERDRDALMAEDLCEQWNIDPVHTSLCLDGGNLISNGQGLLITSTFTLEQNRRRGFKRKDVNRMFREDFGARQIVYLEPLSREPTQHVDMFVTMPTPDIVLLAEYAPEQDLRNHQILERNAQRLREVSRKEGPLKILRVPMPRRGTDIFGGTYTNVLYANGVVFVPRYGNVDPAGHAKAIEIYRQCLPDWKVISVESSAWLALEGSVHCLTKNLYRLPPHQREDAGI